LLAKRIIDERDKKTDGNGREYVIEAVAFKVPESEAFPSGLKYSFHANYLDEEKLILRYDNANDFHAAKHHKHMIENENEITKPLKKQPENIEQLYELFKEWIQKVKTICQENTT